jgi:hypothetical protein
MLIARELPARLAAFLVVSLISFQARAAPTLGERMKAWATDAGPAITLLYIVFFIAGAGLFGSGIIGLRNHGRNPQQNPLGDALWTIFAGLCLASLGGLIAYGQGSIVGDGGATPNFIKPPTFN